MILTVPNVSEDNWHPGVEALGAPVEQSHWIFLPQTIPQTTSLPTQDISSGCYSENFKTGTNPYS